MLYLILNLGYCFCDAILDGHEHDFDKIVFYACMVSVFF